MLIPGFISLPYIAELRLSGSKGQAHTFKCLMIASDPVLEPNSCSLARWTRSIRIQQNGVSKYIGGVIIKNTSLPAADLLMTIVSL